MDDEAAAREAVLAAARGMLDRGLTSGTSGNVSARLAGGGIVVARSALPYDQMTVADLVQLSDAGQPGPPRAGAADPS